MFAVIDIADWQALVLLFTPDADYRRPGYGTMHGIREILAFYRDVRIVARGRHTVRGCLVSEREGFCWGSFEGVSKSGRALEIDFAEWYLFEGGRIRYRRTFFDQPAI